MILTLQQYAHYRRERGLSGGTKTSVARALEAGRITPASARKTRGKWRIDAAKADADWLANTLSTQARSGKRSEINDNPGGGNRKESAELRQQQAHALALNERKAQLMTYDAQLKQLQYEERAGKLCEVAKVKAEYFALARAVRDRVQEIPDRLQSELSDAQHSRLVEEIQSALEELGEC